MNAGAWILISVIVVFFLGWLAGNLDGMSRK